MILFLLCVHEVSVFKRCYMNKTLLTVLNTRKCMSRDINEHKVMHNMMSDMDF